MMSIFSVVSTLHGNVTSQSRYVRRDGIFRCGRRHAGKTANLAVGFFPRFFGHPGSFDLLAQLFDFALVVVGFTQFTLNRAQLLAQKIFALALAHFFLDLVLDLAAQLQNFEFFRQFGIQVLQPLSDGNLLEHELFRNDREVRKIGRDVIGQAAGIFDIDDDRLEIIGQLRRQLDDPLELADDRPAQRLEVDAASSSFSSAIGAIFARRYGSNWVNSSTRVRETPMMITKRLPSGVFMTR